MRWIRRLDRIIFLLLLLSLLVIASRAECEIFNYDINKCELIGEQNLSINPAWVEFY